VLNLVGNWEASSLESATYFADARVEEMISADMIVAGAITAEKIAANAIAVGTAAIQNGALTNAMIQSLNADKIITPNLQAISSTIGLLRTATGGQRVEIESNQIRVYDNANVLRVRMGIW
jgi:hypothetical protein